MNYPTLDIVVLVSETEARMVLRDDSGEELKVIERTRNPDFDFPAMEFWEVAYGTSWLCPILGCGLQAILGCYVQGVLHAQGW